MDKLSIKDLALYLDCKIQYNRVGEEKIETIRRTLTPQCFLTICELSDLVGFADHITDVKPILRPLSDIAEEEMKDIVKLLLDSKELDGRIEYVKDNGDHGCYIDIKYFGGSSNLIPSDVIHIDSSFTVTDDIGHFCNMIKVCMYFISKCFDINGWIEKGLAIDRTTLNTKEG